MESGCIFNSRPAPRCIRDPGSGKVDPQCEKVNGACRLLSSSTPSSTISLPPISIPSVPLPQQKEQQKKTKENEIIIKSGGPNRLSGPISASSTTLNIQKQNINKSFNFFGDAHFSMEGTCKPCKDIDYKTNTLKAPPGSDDCWDISVLLAETFNKYSQEGKYVDFYIESPFIPKTKENQKIPQLLDLISQVTKEGYIPKLEAIFYNCLFKLNCQYSTVRFHYVDIRLGYKTFTLPEMYAALQNEKEVTSKGVIDYEALLSFELVRYVIAMLERKIVTQDRSRNSEIEEINSLMRDFYFSGGQTMAGKVDPKNYRLFELYLTSDDFDNDVRKLLDWSKIKNKKLLEKLENAFTRIKSQDVTDVSGEHPKRKVMHRARAQLYALEKEGKGKLANDIKNFILGEYRKNTERTMNKIVDIWNSAYLTYDGFVNAKYRSMDDIYKVLHAFEKEYANFTKLFGYSVTGFSLLMDAYLLGRMFRGFTPESAKCIVYAGGAHIENYVKFFTQYLDLSSPMIVYNPNNEYVKKGEIHKLSRCLHVDIKDFI